MGKVLIRMLAVVVMAGSLAGCMAEIGDGSSETAAPYDDDINGQSEALVRDWSSAEWVEGGTHCMAECGWIMCTKCCMTNGVTSCSTSPFAI